jgi:hypothetical protein
MSALAFRFEVDGIPVAVESPRHAALLLKMLGRPVLGRLAPARPRASPWSEIVCGYYQSLSRASRTAVELLVANGGTMGTDALARAMGLKGAKSLGPSLRSLRACARPLGRMEPYWIRRSTMEPTAIEMDPAFLAAVSTISNRTQT